MKPLIPSRADYDSFTRTFGVNIRKFWSNFLGLDIIAFDEYLKTPDGVSTKEHIKKTYGPEAVKLVERLLNIRNV